MYLEYLENWCAVELIAPLLGESSVTKAKVAKAQSYFGAERL